VQVVCPKYGTVYLFTSANSRHTLPSVVILRHSTFSQPILPPSGPVMSSDSLLRLWRDINPLLTYLQLVVIEFTHWQGTDL